MSRKSTLIARLAGGCLSVVCFLPLSAEATKPHISQNISLVQGWNAVYVEVSPEQTADELFAAWPVDHVGLYDPASFLATRQFSSDWNSQGLPREAMAVWYRDAPEASSLKSVPAGSVLVTFCKNASFLATLRGAPAAPRTTWHVTGTNTVYNFVGFSVSQQTDISAYLEGSPCENVKSLAYYRIGGDDPNAAPESREVRSWSSNVKDGDVLLLPSDTVSDWSGVLNISPLNGVNFGQTGTLGRLAIRNDGKTNRTVRLTFSMPVNGADLFHLDELPNAVFFRDADAVNGEWLQVATWNNLTRKELAPGETWTLELGLDRSALQLDDRRKGLPFGLLIKVDDESSPAHAKAVIPVYGETSGESADGWERGLWVADVEFDTIRMVDLERTIETNEVAGVQVVSTNVLETSLSEATKTGGKFKVRLPIHRDTEGTQRLLQRVVVSGSTAADGTFYYKLYAGKAEPPATDTTLMRISAVCLPTEKPVIEASPGSRIWSVWTESCIAKFEFTVPADGATSLLRHPYHPQHDGLRWDFKALTPDGDDVFNYRGDVKPETFSVKSEITISYLYSDQRNWNPVYEFSGTCEWRLSGLRHDGLIVVSGPMVIRRVSPNAQLILK